MTTTEILTGIKNWVTGKLTLKQDVINDLASIRSGAQAGATSVQPADILSYFDDAAYDSGTHRINFYHGQSVIAYIDASPFIIDGMVDDVRIENGYLVIDFNTASGKQDISIPLTDIFNPNNYYTKSETDSQLTQKQTEIDDLYARIGYYVCSTEGNVAAKTIVANNYTLGNGGSIKIKMTNANTVNNATLNINSTGAKALYYDGERASAKNSWEAGETVEVYYDGTSFYANNVAGGSGSGDGAFDVSAKYPTSGVDGGNTYTLEGALAVLNANLSASKKKGGMSIKFIHSSDNKYVQYFLTKSIWSSTQSDWEKMNLEEEVSQLGQKKIDISPINLFNPNAPDVLIGYYIGSNGIPEEGSNYNTSGYIAVRTDKTYYEAANTVDYFRFVAFYDINKQFISRIESVTSFTPPSGSVYARITFFKQHYNIAQVSLQNVNFTPYNPIDGYIKDVNRKLGFIGILSDNLFNPNDSDVLLGYYMGNNGITEENANYNVSGFIPVEYGKTYYKALNSDSNYRTVAFYDYGKQFQSAVQNVSNFSPSNGIAYVRITFYVYDYSYAQVSLNTINYTPYREYLTIVNSTGYNDSAISDKKFVLKKDILYGKKWAVLGDSFTEGATDTVIDNGEYAGKLYVYPYLIGNRTGINVLPTFFRSGRTLAFPANPGDFTNSICNPNAACYYQNIPIDTDYITIYLGINDSHHAPESGGGDGEDNTGVIPIGTITDNTTATYYGAWNVVLSWLIENRPFAHIGIIVSNGCDTTEYRTAQLAIAKKYGLPYIDLNGDERTPFMIRSQNIDIDETIRSKRTITQAVNYPSNLHPNDDAHLFESYFIETFLRTI